MIIYPAIDLRGGRVVRLKEGLLERETVFSDDPYATAQTWVSQGAQWIHVVNLDGAFAKANDNGVILERVASLGVKIQFGGGLRTLDDVKRATDSGATRVVIGTAAVENPAFLRDVLALLDVERVCVALDAKDGQIATHAWQQTSALTPEVFGREIAAMGIKHALYTDVRRDGGLAGVNIADTVALGRSTGLQVIASGGVSNVDEITQLTQSGAVAGAVIGMALYEGKLTLEAALRAAEGTQDAG